jgi:hypothetical protein
MSGFDWAALADGVGAEQGTIESAQVTYVNNIPIGVSAVIKWDTGMTATVTLVDNRNPGGARYSQAALSQIASQAPGKRFRTAF